MMIETFALAIWLVMTYYAVTRRPKLSATIRAARPWERVALVALVLPLPGPLDELGAAALVARVQRRAAAGSADIVPAECEAP